ncbi:MAG: hypothetical protein V2I33_24875 [Kangiellaceae bacterium]|jgi:hypothetical protein|nr:hypothetical protein [Kangiellaceae bacterium]
MDETKPKFYDQFGPDDLVICVEVKAHSVAKHIGKWKRPDCHYFLGLVQGNAASLTLTARECEETAKIPSNRFYYVIGITKVSTIIREYRMIHNAEFLRLGEHILDPTLPTTLAPLNVPPDFFATLANKFNES